ncbi:uncharacterized protein [Aristolochia californica]|uniref:uncharacterized protein isoform X2 n=1 Tax=Aristolochia californica TaxID=171875 RepID=UPI0035DB5C23
MESWEALDVDDSDLSAFLPPSTLLPCNRSSPQPQLSLTPSQDPPLLQPCSQLRCPSLPQYGTAPYLEPLSQPTPLQVLIQNCVPPVPEENHIPQVPSKRRIPGPAGTVQAAIHRQNLNPQHKSEPYAVNISQMANVVDDEDFKTSAWLCALDYLGAGTDLATKSALLRSVKTSQRTERVPKLVAIIKSCKPNGLGDLFVTLKDPSATVGATIHRKVVSESNFSKDITVGSVIVLEQVVVFCTFGSAKYLNITIENVVQVFNIESAPRPKRKFPTIPVTCTDYGSQVAAAVSSSVEKRLNRAANEIVTTREAVLEGATQRPREGAAGTSSRENARLGAPAEETNHERNKGKKKLISGVSHTNWTDEQINELFADFEDC